MSIACEQEYLSIGGNRHTAASAWHASTGCLAYGADQNIALWYPHNDQTRGVRELLKGHTDKVNAVAFAHDCEHLLISGAANGEVILWSPDDCKSKYTLLQTVKAHEGAVNVISTLRGSHYFVTGGADVSIKVWRYDSSNIHLVATVKPKPRFIPLALAIGTFSGVPSENGIFIAAGGTRNDIHVFELLSPTDSPCVTLACTLTGHEGWIRSLAIRADHGGYMLASTSADKYVRLWRFQNTSYSSQRNGTTTKDLTSFEQSLTAKAKKVGHEDRCYSITFEALLLGHEDWVYSADWQDAADAKLLTASADGTLAIWEPDDTSGIWVSETRLGEISGQKGATTATGSSGGFWTGKWISDVNTSAVISLGRTGSWRMWHYNKSTNFWVLKPGIGGHFDSVNSLAWSPGGEYLLSTSSDQTTRLHAEWKRKEKRTWHEFSRCQIHGYDCNVVTCINPNQFVSGADEKLLRVFNEPKELADTLHQLCEIELPHDASLPESASIPVLGLSNKEIGQPDDIIEAGPRRGDEEYAAASALAGLSLRGISEPPTEDLLSRHTLWPEHEKLYGHGHEISECAYKDGILATSCKASSIDHATIRLYDPYNEWRQIEPPLTAHSLTVTRLAWSVEPEQYLLSVGRDRQWTVFIRRKVDQEKNLQLYQSMPKAHSRMILDACWSPVSGNLFFATAGRDKTVKLWGYSSKYVPRESQSDSKAEAQFQLCTTVSRPAAVTAIDIISDATKTYAILAVGEEDGTLSLHVFNINTLNLEMSLELQKDLNLPKAVNRLAWRPEALARSRKDRPGNQIAVAGADGSVRILQVDLSSLYEDIRIAKGV